MRRKVVVTTRSEFWIEFDGRTLTESEAIARMNAERMGANAFHGRPDGSIMSSAITDFSYAAEWVGE